MIPLVGIGMWVWPSDMKWDNRRRYRVLGEFSNRRMKSVWVGYIIAMVEKHQRRVLVHFSTNKLVVELRAWYLYSSRTHAPPKWLRRVEVIVAWTPMVRHTYKLCLTTAYQRNPSIIHRGELLKLTLVGERLHQVHELVNRRRQHRSEIFKIWLVRRTRMTSRWRKHLCPLKAFRERLALFSWQNLL